jgi:glycolate oxidase FAD binding subunit
VNDLLKPATDWELQGMVKQLASRGLTLELVGNGTKRSVGRPVSASMAMTTVGMRGIAMYEPTELVMSARAGTPLSQIEVELAGRGQMLAFEPVDLGPALGTYAGSQTIGAVFACNLSGARRISAGAARDHLIGIKGVNGRAEAFKSGGRVMKNVTGVDVARGMAGSWGTLGAITEVTFKVLPIPEDTATLVYTGLTDDLAVELMCAAIGSPFEVSGTVHLPAGLGARLLHDELRSAGRSLTAIRLENFPRSVAYRKERMKQLLKVYGPPLELEQESSLKFWGELRRLSVMPFGGQTYLWKISTSPKAAPQLVNAIRRHMGDIEVMYDWSGGLVWLETPASADAGAADIRRALATHGGYATLIRADGAVRESVDVFQPLNPVVERLSRGLKSAFDPHGVFNPGRMYATM